MTIQSQLQAKLCIAIRLTSEVRMHLNASSSWKQSSLDPRTLIKIFRFQDEEFVGMLFEQSEMDFKEISKNSAQLIAELQKHCPELSERSLDPCVLAQLFLS